MKRNEFLAYVKRFNAVGWYCELLTKEGMIDHCASTRIDFYDAFLYTSDDDCLEAKAPDYDEVTYDEAAKEYRRLFKSARWIEYNDGYGWCLYLHRDLTEQELDNIFTGTFEPYIDALEEMELEQGAA